MSRSFDAADMVVLPVLDVSGAITLGEALLTAAGEAGKTHKLPKVVSKALGTLTIRHQALRAGAAERLSAGQNVDGTRTVLADRHVDAAWGALSLWVAGWSKLPDSLPQPTVARMILEEIFPDGLRFLTLPYKIEWAESELRILRLRTQKYDAFIESLGGKPFLDELLAAHTEYGEALGIKKAPEKPATEANLRDTLAAFRNALRTYVLRVSAQVEDDDAESVDFADTLLAPLVNWSSASRSTPESTAATPEGAPSKVEG